ncbi:NADP-dependent oxidoreductase [Nocardioides sp. Soil797]|nr:NADP-dependent oxidoreductase [Nocardioides sp. Soil797]
MPTPTREIHLSSRPSGWPTHDNFRTVSTNLPDPAEGQVVVRNLMMSVDPYMRGRMSDAKSYVAPFALDAPLQGGAVGAVIASASDALAVGDVVLHGLGWREHALLDDTAVRKVDTDAAPASAYLGVLGMTGLTAYVGLTRIGQFHEGETVFVSGAAGAVGSMVGQLAKNLGAGTVIGSAGSPEKVAWLKEIGFDEALNYKDAPIAAQLQDLPDIDVYFDNVGGDHLEAAISNMADFGRIACCGAIAGYNATEPTPGPRNMMMLVSKRLTMRGFIVGEHSDLAGEFFSTVGPWLADGRIQHRETFVDGLDHAVDAFLDLMHGANTGKMLVNL